MSLSIYFNDDVVSFVLSLRFSICPSTILRTISLIVIDTVYCKSLLPSMGISPFKKSRQIMPFFANRDPACTITRIIRCFLILTPANHIIPHPIQARPVFRGILSCIEARLGSGFVYLFEMKATTGGCISTLQRICWDFCVVSTITLAFPICSIIFCESIFLNNKASESLTYKVCSFGHFAHTHAHKL